MDGMAETPVIECVTPLRNVEAGIDAQKCLAVLSETERSVVLLFYMNDLPIKEIVKITGMPEGTVKSHLSRAKVKMAKVFNV